MQKCQKLPAERRWEFFDSSCSRRSRVLVSPKTKELMAEPFHSTSRRNFLKSTLTLPVAFAAAPTLFSQSAGAAEVTAGPLPKRALGKSEASVTMLCMGGMMSALSPDYIDIAWSMGIRYFDTAEASRKGFLPRGSPNIPNGAKRFFWFPRIIRTRGRSSCWR